MHDIFYWFRLLNFLWAGLLFVGMLYWGVMDLIFASRCNQPHVPPEHHMWAFTAFIADTILAFGTAEILLRHDNEAGIRVFLPWIFLLVGTKALQMGAYRVQLHKKSVRMGLCS